MAMLNNDEDSVSVDLFDKAGPEDYDQGDLDVSDVGTAVPVRDATVTGVIKTISPMRKSQKSAVRYALGRIGDGRRSLNFSCFNEKQYETLKSLSMEKAAVKLGNVDTRIKNDGSMNIVFKQSSTVSKTCKEYPVERPAVVLLDEVTHESTVTFEVTKVHDVTNFSGTNGPVDRQTVEVCDESGEHTLTLWGTSCGVLSVNTMYTVTGMSKNGSGQLAISPYSQIDKVDRDFTNHEIFSVGVTFKICCGYCDTDLGCVTSNTVKCPVCNMRSLRKRTNKEMEGLLIVEDSDGKRKRMKLDKEGLAKLLNCSLKEIEAKEEKDIESDILSMEKIQYCGTA